MSLHNRTTRILTVMANLLLVVVLLTTSQLALAEGLTGSEREAILYDANLYRELKAGQEGCVPTPDGEAPADSVKPSDKLAAFVDKYVESAYANSLETGIPYDFTLGQAILESGYGNSELAAKYNNFFGIKAGKSWTGQTVSMRTREVVNGRDVFVNAAFRAYPSPAAGFADHDRFLRENKRYAAAFNYPNDSYKFLVEIKKAGYATDPKYVSIVWNVIQSVQKHLATTGKYPPIAEVKYNIADPAAPTPVTAPDPVCSTVPSSGDIGLVKSATLPTSGTMKPTGIILHWWGGTGGIGSLIGTLKSRGLSVQIGTTQDGVVHQLTANLNDVAGHARCANGWAIGNEIEGGVRLRKENGQTIAVDLAENQKQFEAVVDITAKLMTTYNIPLDGSIAPGGKSGSGVHSHKEVDSYCENGTGKPDVDDIYLARVKDALRKKGFK